MLVRCSKTCRLAGKLDTLNIVIPQMKPSNKTTNCCYSSSKSAVIAVIPAAMPQLFFIKSIKSVSYILAWILLYKLSRQSS